MPQGRIILKSISQSRKLAKLKTDGARLLYTWLLPHLDINGCLHADPIIVKGQVFTRLKKSTKTITSYLNDLNHNGLIVLYKTNDDWFLYVPDFVDKQPSLNPDREAKSTIPMPTPEQLKSYSRLTPLKVKESKVKESKYTPEFENFWKLFKGRWKPKEGDYGKYEKGSKADAFIEWEKLTSTEQQEATKAAPHSGGEFTPDCCRWLKQKRWEK